jgi:hypothetical protein
MLILPEKSIWLAIKESEDIVGEGDEPLLNVICGVINVDVAVIVGALTDIDAVNVDAENVDVFIVVVFIVDVFTVGVFKVGTVIVFVCILLDVILLTLIFDAPVKIPFKEEEYEGLIIFLSDII